MIDGDWWKEKLKHVVQIGFAVSSNLVSENGVILSVFPQEKKPKKKNPFLTEIVHTLL